MEEAEAHEKICTGTPSMMVEENNVSSSESEERSDELQTNFESRLSGLLGQIHTDDNVITNKCAQCGKEGSDVNNECNKCHAVKYCNAACKKKHRKKHKKQCERMMAYNEARAGLANSNISEEQYEKMKKHLEQTQAYTQCKDDNCTRNAKLSNGYCLMCDRKYNHGGSDFKQSKAHREEKEKDMNMDACYLCQEEDKGECILLFGISAYDMILF